MVDINKVADVAALARLSLTTKEQEAMVVHLNAILSHVDALKDVDTTGVAPTCYTTPSYDPTRPDEVIPSLSAADLLKNGPDVRKGHFAIPRVIG